MQPDIWGKYLWLSLHYIALGYPDIPTTDEALSYSQFFNNLVNVLPCPTCAEHYQQMLRRLPLTDDVLTNNETLFKWTVDIHNMVNKETGKKQMSYKDALTFYSDTLAKQNGNIKDIFSGTTENPVYLTGKLSRRILIITNIFIIIFIAWMFFSRRFFQKRV